MKKEKRKKETLEEKKDEKCHRNKREKADQCAQ